MAHAAHHAPVNDKTELPPERSDLGLIRPDRTTGILDWLTTVDHKKIGILYGYFAMFFFLVGGVEALAIRTQLAEANNTFLTARMYNQMFTMHGTTMIFLGVMPLSAAFFNFLVPLQIGARDVAFPRLNAFSLWTFVFGATVLNASWFFELGHLKGWFADYAWYKSLVYTDFAPANGWFSYAPLSGTFGQANAALQAQRFTGVGQMKQDFIAQFPDAEAVAMNAAVVTQKLQQMAAGFVYVTPDDAHWFSDHKLDLVEEIYCENQQAPVIVVYTYRAELRALKKRFPFAATLDEDDDMIARWNAGKVRMLLVHPKSAGHGLNLQAGGHHMIWTSLPWSLELYEQTIGRLHRSGQRHDVWNYVLQTRETIDKTIWAALHDKRSLSDLALEALK